MMIWVLTWIVIVCGIIVGATWTNLTFGDDDLGGPGL
jgi:hypothetical protein